MTELKPKWYRDIPIKMLRCSKCGELGYPVYPLVDWCGHIKCKCTHLKILTLNIG